MSKKSSKRQNQRLIIRSIEPSIKDVKSFRYKCRGGFRIIRKRIGGN